MNAQPGDIAHLIDPRGKSYLVQLKPGAQFQSHHGVIPHEAILGKPWGRRVFSHLEKPFLVLQPSLNDLLLRLRRATTIMYPKDIGFLLVNMNIGPGQRVLEAGSGSGGLTIALAHAVGSQGQVFSYDARAENQEVARRNVERLGLSDRVTFKVRDVSEGFDEQEIDALFLDLPNPHDYLPQTRAALKPSGFFGSLLPTVNQVSLLLDALESHSFAFPEVCEILLRYYNPVGQRLRPKQRMVAHTGFLIFARKMQTKETELHPTGDPHA